MKNEMIVINERTGENIFKSHPTDKEVFFQGGNMITETDIRGVITYANRKFRDLTGYTKDELIGSPHNINRHPDMPKGAFRGMWKTISGKRIWKGCVKNMTKDGSFYWVLVYVQPIMDRNGKITKYTAARKIVSPAVIKEASALYEKYSSDRYIDHKVFFSEHSEHH